MVSVEIIVATETTDGKNNRHRNNHGNFGFWYTNGRNVWFGRLWSFEFNSSGILIYKLKCVSI